MSSEGAPTNASPRWWDIRPVVIPDDVDDPATVKASGVIRLPLRVRWSAPFRDYDLADRRDRALVYEQVLTEGTEEDVRYFIDVDELVALWPELYLPKPVRRAWATWLKERRGRWSAGDSRSSRAARSSSSGFGRKAEPDCLVHEGEVTESPTLTGW